MNFNELPEFRKESKRLGKKYRSLSEDLQLFKKILAKVPLGTDKHFAVLFRHEAVQIAKARLFCKYLKKDALRIIYAYHPQEQEIMFIELYYKGDQLRENQQRISDYLKELPI